MSHFRIELRQRAEKLLAPYPRKRSAKLRLLHLAQEQDGYLSVEGIDKIGELTGTNAADVRGTASCYDMFHFQSVGKYVVGVCTTIACLLRGADAMLEYASTSLGRALGATSDDGPFTLEETRGLADCKGASLVQMNYPDTRTTMPEIFDAMIEDLLGGRLDHEVLAHGTLRVRCGDELRADRGEVTAKCIEARFAREQRIAKENE
jgi:NADH:ubiquinone oxidoreductase subunit E